MRLAFWIILKSTVPAVQITNCNTFHCWYLSTVQYKFLIWWVFLKKKLAYKWTSGLSAHSGLYALYNGHSRIEVNNMVLLDVNLATSSNIFIKQFSNKLEVREYPEASLYLPVVFANLSLHHICRVFRNIIFSMFVKGLNILTMISGHTWTMENIFLLNYSGNITQAIKLLQLTLFLIKNSCISECL